jgi:hypothetical protein
MKSAANRWVLRSDGGWLDEGSFATRLWVDVQAMPACLVSETPGPKCAAESTSTHSRSPES